MRKSHKIRPTSENNNLVTKRLKLMWKSNKKWQTVVKKWQQLEKMSQKIPKLWQKVKN